MPREIPNDLSTIGGKLTDLGREDFLRKAQELRERIMASEPNSVDITGSVFASDFRGTLSKTVANSGRKNRKGKTMPKITSNLVNVTSVAGKRGRKSELNPTEWKMEVGIENSFDVTDEMTSAIEAYCTKNKLKVFAADVLFGNDNADANKYRSNRYGTMKRAAIVANGEDSKYELNSAENSDGERIWVFNRTA